MSIFINKPMTMSNGASVEHHRVVAAKLSDSLLTIEVELESWPSEEIRLGGQPSVARAIFRLPMVGLGSSSGFVDDLCVAMVGTHGLTGGVIVPDITQTLEGLKLLKRAEINMARDVREFGTFTWDGSTFDADTVSRGRLGDAVMLSLMGPISQDWTLADNSVRTLSGTELQQLAGAMAVWVGGLHAQARSLKAAVDAAVTVEELNSITWVD